MTTVHQPASNVTVTAQGDLSNLHYSHIICFNNTIHRIFTDEGPIPDGKKHATLAIDISGSMDHPDARDQLQVVVAELTKGTNAEGNMAPIPMPDCPTGLVEAVAELNRLAPEAEFKGVATDGYDNLFKGKLAIGMDAATGGLNEVEIDNTTTNNNAHVCDHIEHVMGAQAFIVGINAPDDLLTRLEGRRATVVNIPRGQRNPASIIGALRVGRRVRQSGSTANRQILTTTPEAEAIAAAIPEAEVAAINVVANAVVINTSPAPPPPVTEPEFLEAIKTTNAILKNPAADGDEFKELVALVCFFGTASLDGDGIPGASLFGRHCGMLEEKPRSDLKKTCNQGLPKFGDRIFTKTGTTGPTGAQLTVNGRLLKFAKNCDIFKCHVPIEVLQSVAANREVCADITAAFTSSKNSPLKRAREGPDDSAVQPARASPGAGSADDAAEPAGQPVAIE